MSDEIVILGRNEAKLGSGELSITTPHGDVLHVLAAEVIRTEDADASGEIKRYVIPASAQVAIEIEGRHLTGLEAHNGTILKWRDDGGTIFKSRDDT